MTEIRSYRRVFDLERRIYRIDRLRLNPGGVPVLGIVYFLILLAASVIAGRLPLLGGTVGALPWYVRNLALPGACATVLGVIRIEGRPFHLAAQALIRYASRPRCSSGVCGRATVGVRWLPAELLILPDGSDAGMRRLRYTGPGAVLVAVEHERAGRIVEQGPAGLARRSAQPRLILCERPAARALEQAEVICLARGMRLVVRPQARARAASA